MSPKCNLEQRTVVPFNAKNILQNALGLAFGIVISDKSQPGVLCFMWASYCMCAWIGFDTMYILPLESWADYVGIKLGISSRAIISNGNNMKPKRGGSWTRWIMGRHFTNAVYSFNTASLGLVLIGNTLGKLTQESQKLRNSSLYSESLENKNFHSHSQKKKHRSITSPSSKHIFHLQILQMMCAINERAVLHSLPLSLILALRRRFAYANRRQPIPGYVTFTKWVTRHIER